MEIKEEAIAMSKTDLKHDLLKSAESARSTVENLSQQEITNICSRHDADSISELAQEQKQWSPKLAEKLSDVIK